MYTSFLVTKECTRLEMLLVCIIGLWRFNLERSLLLNRCQRRPWNLYKHQSRYAQQLLVVSATSFKIRVSLLGPSPFRLQNISELLRRDLSRTVMLYLDTNIA